MTHNRENITFQTIDGLTIKGWLYPAPFGPAIIITPGLLCVKEMFVPQVAEVFQAEGINALIYDPRNTGESEGQPRHEISPSKQVSDYSDALTFLLSRETVDPTRIAFWGMSFSATVALCAVSLDKRARLCIAVCPFLELKPPPELVPQVLVKCMEDRESRNVGNPSTTLPTLTATGKNPAGLHIRPTPEELELILNAQRRGAPNFENKCTLETYYNFLTWSPEDIIRYLPPTPVLFIVPEEDTWSLPDRQLALYESLSPPKQVHKVPGKGHLTLFSGEDFPNLMRLQVTFLKRELQEEVI